MPGAPYRPSAPLSKKEHLPVRESKKFLAELKQRGIPVRDLEDDEWHILVYAHYASLAELVLHNYPKETALKYAHTLAAFFEAGWKAVLGLP